MTVGDFHDVMVKDEDNAAAYLRRINFVDGNDDYARFDISEQINERPMTAATLKAVEDRFKLNRGNIELRGGGG